jgi:hypothetical protein
MSGSKNPTKPSLSLGYVTATPKDLLLSVQRLSIQREEESQDTLLIMDRDATPVLIDSNFGR